MINSLLPKPRLFLFSWILILFFYFFSVDVRAQDVSSNYQVTYQVQPSGVTKVTQDIKLSGGDDFYVSEYTLTLKSTAIANVIAQDQVGKITPQFEVGEGTSLIKVPLRSHFETGSATQDFRLIYDAQDLALKNGQLWEISIPKIASSDEIVKYDVFVVIPHALGDLNFIHPQPLRREKGSENTTLIFDHAQMRDSGLLIEVGKEQYYNFHLLYHLKNDTTWRGKTQIALIPDLSNFQSVKFASLNPLPEKVEIDGDGNYLATYSLDSHELLDVDLKGMVKVVADSVPRQSQLTLTDVPVEVKSIYTRELPYWSITDDNLKSFAQSKVVGLENVYDQALALYNCTIEMLTYSPSRLGVEFERYGAVKAFAQPAEALCSEYADLYVTLARSIGIPARLLSGYAYTPDREIMPVQGDVLHAWVQVYLPPRGWLPIDPTWGDTTGGVDYFNRFDANHVVFAIQGLDSERPVPAGAYKLDPQNLGDVKITFASENEIDNFESQKGSYDLKLQVKERNHSGLPVRGVLTIRNTGGILLTGGQLSVFLGEDQIISQQLLAEIPPYGKFDTPFSLNEVGIWETFSGDLIAETSFDGIAGGQKTIQRVYFSPLSIVIVVGGLILLGAMSLLYVIWRWRSNR